MIAFPQNNHGKDSGWGKARGKMRRLITIAVVMVVIAAGGAGAWYWWQQHKLALPAGFAKANGRLESEQVEIATKLAGRIAVILVSEGQLVDAGQVVARMDTTELEAQLRAAEAQVSVAEHQKKQAESRHCSAGQQSNLRQARARSGEHPLRKEVWDAGAARPEAQPVHGRPGGL
jgi:HlyD family secretion protein